MTKMIWTSISAALLLASSVQAGVGRMGAMARREIRSDTRVQEVVSPKLQTRQSSSINLSPGSSLNLTQWNSETSAACVSALSQLSVASNPSGTAVCYNVQTLDTNTGAFMADLRLFQISTPSGDFLGIPPQNIQVGLQYHGASVSPVNGSSTISARDVGDLSKRTTAPTVLQAYMFVGQIDAAQMAQPMTTGGLEALLMPTVTLNGVNSAGNTISTNVSANEAAFVNGVFSTEVIMSDLALAQVAVNQAVADLKNGKVAFILPGTQIMIFPVGLVITGIWTIVGVGIYTFGTFERIRYAESFNRRRAAAGKSASGRI